MGNHKQPRMESVAWIHNSPRPSQSLRVCHSTRIQGVLTNSRVGLFQMGEMAIMRRLEAQTFCLKE